MWLMIPFLFGNPTIKISKKTDENFKNQIEKNLSIKN